MLLSLIRRNQFRDNAGSKGERVNFKIRIGCCQLQEVAAEFFIVDKLVHARDINKQ
jgi:hypothetical protein